MAVEKKYGVTCKPNVAPAHTTITKIGTGSTWWLAVYRALKEIKKDPRIKGKRKIFPMHLYITDANVSYEDD